MWPLSAAVAQVGRSGRRCSSCARLGRPRHAAEERSMRRPARSMSRMSPVPARGSGHEPRSGEPARGHGALLGAAVAIYTLTMFASAALLFTVEPMFAKMALPLLGGAPSVWNTALVFFQVVLLAGYL